MGAATDNLGDLVVARWLREGRGEEVAVVDDTGTWTFAELNDAAARAGGTLADRGVQPGDRVALALPDSRVWVAGFLGATRIGAVAAALDPDGPLGDKLADAEPAVLIADAGVGPAGLARIGPDGLLAGLPLPLAPVSGDDLAYLVYSSGSTGRPKAAMHRHADLRVGIETYATEVLRLEPSDRCVSLPRLSTSLGFGNGFFRVLGRGATAVLRERQPGASLVPALVADEKVSVLSAVPTSWAQLASLAAKRTSVADALRGLRAGVSSGDALPPTVAEALRDATGLELLVGLGCSECSNIVISSRLGEPADGTLGSPVPGVEIDLRDEQERQVAPGTPGRLWVRSGSNTSGYWRRPDLTEEVVRGDWLRMSDMLVEREGRYAYVGRVDDTYKVDGGWVSGTQVEAALLRHPSIWEAAVVARPDRRGLSRTSAAIVIEADSEPPAEEELRHIVSAEVGEHAIPRAFSIRDALPRLPSGKVDRRALREEPNHAWQRDLS